MLITGAAGTVGTLLTNLFTEKGITVVAIDRSESGVANLMRMKLRLPNPDLLDIRYGDLLHPALLNESMNGCDTIIHCAALKHVSVGAYFPAQLAYENITVFSNLISAVQKHKSVCSVLICSSDKAAIPTSVMGASKFLIERMSQHVPGTDAKFVAVRFGNVLGSSGSLSEVVENCIKQKCPFMLNNAQMTRYILKKDNLLNLITDALVSGLNGEIWTLNLPSAKVTDLIQIFSERLGCAVPEMRIIENRYLENIHEALFNTNEIKHVRYEKQNYLVFNQDYEYQLPEQILNNVVSSGNANLGIEKLRKYINP